MNKARFLAHSMANSHRRRVDSARRLCVEWLEKCKNPSIAFSAGKDSTVLLHIVRSIYPDCRAHYSHPEYELAETRALIDSTPNIFQYAYKNKHSDFFTAWADDEKEMPDGVDWFSGKSSKQWVIESGIDGVAVGIRADENSYRKIAIRKYGALFYVQSKKIWQCWAIHNWSVDDVWAYIISNKVDYNRAYDRMDAAGIELSAQRIGPFANSKALKMGQLAILRTVFPEQYQRFVAKFPEASNYT